MSELLLAGASVFDGTQLRPGVTDVVVRDGIIVAVGADLTAAGARRIDCTGQVLMPGLIDGHTHVAWAGPAQIPQSRQESLRRGTGNLAALLAAGVTSVRDVGGPLDVLAELKSALQTGSIPGPELRHAGHLLCAHGGHGTEIPLPVPIAFEVASETEMETAARTQISSGAELIKVTLNSALGAVELEQSVVAAAVRTGRRLGMPTTCHASVEDAISVAIAAGADCIEHGNGLTSAQARELGARGGAMVPTVSIFQALHTEMSADRTTVFGDESRESAWSAVRRRVREHPPAIDAARRHGVRLGFGTDRVPGWEVVAVVEEARAMHSLGLSVVEVLRAATIDNATIARFTDRGRVIEGARADLVAFDDSLQSELEALGEPRLVLQAGELR